MFNKMRIPVPDNDRFQEFDCKKFAAFMAGILLCKTINLVLKSATIVVIYSFS